MKKHSHQEILLKLDQAAELARAGKSQVEVCKALGVSVMTFHRWRKLPMFVKAKEDAPAIVPEPPSNAEPPNVAEMARLLEELSIENRRLRKIVTDLLLEKIKLEESTAALLPNSVPGKTMAAAPDHS
jgi:transposase-like protein